VLLRGLIVIIVIMVIAWMIGKLLRDRKER
jgi:hypothetical protein